MLKKLAILIPSLKGGGGENVVRELIKYFDRSNIQLIIITFLGNNRPFESPNIRYYNLNIKYNSSITGRISAVAKKIRFINNVVNFERPDLVYSCMAYTNIIALVSSINKNRLVISQHNIHNENRLIKIAITYLYHRAKAIVAVSEGVKRDILNVNPKLKIETIYNPIDFQQVDRLSNDRIDFDEEFFLAVGRLEYQKGFDLLIMAYAKIAPDKRKKLLIIGEGSQKTNLIQLVAKASLDGHVVFLGYNSNPYKYMKRAKGFILSSRWEGFGLVLAEALFLNPKVAASDCNHGPKEIISICNSKSILFEAGSETSLVTALNQIENITEDMESVRKALVTNFDTISIGNKYMDFFKRQLNEENCNF